MAKRKYDNSSRQLKKAGITEGVVVRDAEWQKRRPKKQIPGAPKVRPKGTKALALSEEAKQEMIKDRARGMSIRAISEQYQVAESYVKDAVRTAFVEGQSGTQALKGLLLENALASGMRVRETVNELQPMQAVIATGVMTQRFIDLDKHTQAAPPSVDFAQLSQIGTMLRDLQASVGLDDDDTLNQVIDIQAEVG